ncbi:MAG: lysozyme inhibitor LprI family protein [Pseudomonadota bacterium]
MLMVLMTGLFLQPSCQIENPGMADMRACTFEQLELEEVRLKHAYQFALDQAAIKDAEFKRSYPNANGSSWVAKIRISQGQWLKYRDSQCESESYTMRPGNGTVGVETHCKLEKTKARVSELRELFNNQ